ncbi:unnamed protein product [Prorocentrum cordatum]|uniref:Uncharacterized protein n=1 Tax=Prorocentrum cordatum TaxID=2364126 RepID=A0ABN9UIM3_9DINO|nr:unnamed protein product [Polarella glacialis]
MGQRSSGRPAGSACTPCSAARARALASSCMRAWRGPLRRFSPDGRRVLTTTYPLAAGAGPGRAKVWSATSGQCLLTFSHDDWIGCAVFSADGQAVLTQSSGTVKVWSATSGECMQTLRGHQNSFEFAIFSPNGQWVLTSLDDHTAKVWSVTSGECLQTLRGHEELIYSAVFSPNGQRVLTTAFDNAVKAWSATSGECLRTFVSQQEIMVDVLVSSSDGQWVLTASADQTAKVWSAFSGECLRTLEGYQGELVDAVFSPDGKQILTVSLDGTSNVWSRRKTRKRRKTAASREGPCALEGHKDRAVSAVFSPDGQHVVTFSPLISDNDSVAKVWSADSGECLHTLEGAGRFACFAP